MMRVMIRLGAVAMTVMFCGGCMSNLAGTWRTAPDQPPGKINFGSMTLANDGTFTAEAQYSPDKTEVLSGFYSKEGWNKGKITFEPSGGGPVRTYDYKVEGDDLTITHEDHSVMMSRLKR